MLKDTMAKETSVPTSIQSKRTRNMVIIRKKNYYYFFLFYYIHKRKRRKDFNQD